jgi:hypothetical protein
VQLKDRAARSIWDRFFDFIAPGADRYAIIISLLESLKLNSVVISIRGNRHIFVFPPGKNVKPSAGGAFPFRGQRPAILTAHYDRVEGSPGANDNSAAVFMLLIAAARLGLRGIDRWIIIFTDKEELKAGEGIREQGAFSLAEKLRAWNVGGARVFNFDACGTGEAIIISSTSDYLTKSDCPLVHKTRLRLHGLRSYALDTAHRLHLDRVFIAPTPFSDDAGFLRAGFPALTITMLPASEAASYLSLLDSRPAFASAVISGTTENSAERQLIPETWRTLNGPLDSHLRLTPQHYERIVRFAVELCKGK